MTWNSTWPLGTVSVKANGVTGRQNTSYIETKMGNSVVGTNGANTRDHFWNVDPNLDGHHRFVKSPAFVNSGGSPTHPQVGTGMDSVTYCKLTSSDVQPFFRNASMVMQLLAIRACAVFDATGTLAYSHNVVSVTRSAEGRYTINFSESFPSNSYLVCGGAIRNDSDATKELILEMQAGTTINSVKSTSSVKVMTKSDGGSFHDPLQAWVVCFGG